MTVLAPPNAAPFFLGQEVAVVAVRSGVLADISPVVAVSPLGDVAAAGWEVRFSPDGLEIREPGAKAGAKRRDTCEVFSLQGDLLSSLPRLLPRGQAGRRRGARWSIRAATPEDRIVLDARDRDLDLMRLMVRHLASAVRSAAPLAMLLDRAEVPRRRVRAAEPTALGFSLGVPFGQNEASSP
jgi:hypothetical protein